MGVNQVKIGVDRIGLFRVKIGVNWIATYPPMLGSTRENEFGNMLWSLSFSIIFLLGIKEINFLTLFKIFAFFTLSLKYKLFTYLLRWSSEPSIDPWLTRIEMVFNGMISSISKSRYWQASALLRYSILPGCPDGPDSGILSIIPWSRSWLSKSVLNSNWSDPGRSFSIFVTSKLSGP